jgi:hypothetical protein
MMLLSKLGKKFLMWIMENLALWRFQDERAIEGRESKYSGARQLAGASELPGGVRFSNSIP